MPANSASIPPIDRRPLPRIVGAHRKPPAALTLQVRNAPGNSDVSPVPLHDSSRPALAAQPLLGDLQSLPVLRGILQTLAAAGCPSDPRLISQRAPLTRAPAPAPAPARLQSAPRGDTTASPVPASVRTSDTARASPGAVHGKSDAPAPQATSTLAPWQVRLAGVRAQWHTRAANEGPTASACRDVITRHTTGKLTDTALAESAAPAAAPARQANGTLAPWQVRLAQVRTQWHARAGQQAPAASAHTDVITDQTVRERIARIRKHWGAQEIVQTVSAPPLRMQRVVHVPTPSRDLLQTMAARRAKQPTMERLESLLRTRIPRASAQVPHPAGSYPTLPQKGELHPYAIKRALDAQRSRS